MSLTPIQTTHVLSINYVQSGKTHHQHNYVDAEVSGDSTGWSLIGSAASPTGLSNAVDQWQAKIGPLLGLGTTAGGYTLYRFDSPDLIPIFSGSYSFDAVGGGLTLTSQETLFFRDGLNKPLKFSIFEVNNAVPFHSTSTETADVGVALHNAITDMLDGSSGHMGGWLHSRSDSVDLRFIATTNSLNRKLRRARGFA